MPTNLSQAETARVPLACVAGAIPADERSAHFALLKRLFGEDARERRVIADGYAFRFGAASFDDVARFIARERLCCPFLTFHLELAQSSDLLWLQLTGPEGTRELLDAELPARAW